MIDLTIIPNESCHSTLSIGVPKHLPLQQNDEDSLTVKDLPQKPKRNVHFKPSVKVRKIPTRSSFSEKERNLMFYSQDEINGIRMSSVATVKKMMKGENVDADDSDCSRGLEFREPSKNKTRQTRKMKIMMAVLFEQQTLRDEDQEDIEEFLSEVYKRDNWICAVEARKRGLQDALDAL
jgi:hypothetical protein